MQVMVHVLQFLQGLPEGLRQAIRNVPPSNLQLIWGEKHDLGARNPFKQLGWWWTCPAQLETSAHLRHAELHKHQAEQQQQGSTEQIPAPWHWRGSKYWAFKNIRRVRKVEDSIQKEESFRKTVFLTKISTAGLRTGLIWQMAKVFSSCWATRWEAGKGRALRHTCPVQVLLFAGTEFTAPH